MNKDIAEQSNLELKNKPQVIANNKISISVIVALLTVYIIWGSTYLAIKIAIVDMPPFFMAGSRNIISGLIMYSAASFFTKKKLSLKQWINAAMVGIGLLLIGNGCVAWAETRMPSGIAALFIATEPIWILIISFLTKRDNNISKIDIISIILGFIGVIILVSQNFIGNHTPINLGGVFAVLLASFSWAVGSIIMQRRFISDNSFQATSMVMLTGGLFLMIASFFTEKFSYSDILLISHSSLIAYVYLITLGSLVGFSAYTWLLGNASMTLASTYAFVNPVVAVMLGYFLAKEPMNLQIILASGVIILSVVLIVMKDKINLKMSNRS